MTFRPKQRTFFYRRHTEDDESIERDPHCSIKFTPSRFLHEAHFQECNAREIYPYTKLKDAKCQKPIHLSFEEDGEQKADS